MITQTYNLNLIPDRVPVIVNCSQYDANSRTIEMVIYDGSVLYTIPSGASATVRGTKQDNTGFEYPCTIDGSKVSFDIQDQMTIFAGKVPCEIRLADANGFVGTCNFLLNVEETPLDPDVTISETDLPLLEEAEQNAIRSEQARDEAEELLSSVVKSVNGETPDADGNVEIQVSSPIVAGTGIEITNDVVTNTAPLWHGDEVGSLPVPLNADQLQGHEASYFQQALSAGSGITIQNNTVAFDPSTMPFEEGALDVISTAQSMSQYGYRVCGNMMEVWYRIQAPSGGFANNTVLFTMPYPVKNGGNILSFTSSDQYMSSNREILFGFTSTNSNAYKIGLVSANYWVLGHFTTFINR